MSLDLHNAMLQFDGDASLLARALGRGGAPIDLTQARTLLPEVEAAVAELRRLLPVDWQSDSARS